MFAALVAMLQAAASRLREVIREALRPTSAAAGLARDAFRTRAQLLAENALLRQQLIVAVLGQLLLVQRRIENWGCWLLVNTLAVPVYFSRGLALTSLLYAAYWVNAVISLRHWRIELAAEAREQVAVSPS